MNKCTQTFQLYIMLLGPPKIGSIHFHCKCLRLAAVFIFFKENDRHIKIICYVINFMPQMLFFELCLYWTWSNPKKVKNRHTSVILLYMNELCAPSGFEQFWGQKCFSDWLFVGGKSRWYVLPRELETFSLGATYSSYFTTWTGSQQLHRRNKKEIWVCFPEVLCLLFKSCWR